MENTYVSEANKSVYESLLYNSAFNPIEGNESIDSGLDVQRALTKMELRDDPNNVVANNYLSQLDSLENLCDLPGGFVLEKQLNTPEDISDAIKKYNL